MGLTIKELIELLQQCQPEAQVCIDDPHSGPWVIRGLRAEMIDGERGDIAIANTVEAF